MYFTKSNLKMQPFRVILNAIAVHQSYLHRPVMISKPSFCNSLQACMKYPILFEDSNLCPSCTCTYVCRYSGKGPSTITNPPLNSFTLLPNQADIGAAIFPAETYPITSKSSTLKSSQFA